MVEMESSPELEAGDTIPWFELPGTDGETYTPDSFADARALLVVFTCNHCPYAKAKFELLNELSASYDDAVIVGINPNDASAYPADSHERMAELVDAGTIDWDAYLRDERQSVAASFGAVCTPDPFLFARRDDEWRLVYQGRLDDALDPDATPTRYHSREAIEAILADDPVNLEWQPSRGCSIKWKTEP